MTFDDSNLTVRQFFLPLSVLSRQVGSTMDNVLAIYRI